jgi:hypothetical protein
MTINRMEHVSVVDDLPRAIAFFTTLGMAVEGEALRASLSRWPRNSFDAFRQVALRPL